MNLSDHFTLDEALFSSTATRYGFDNNPADEILENMKFAAQQMEAVRAILGRAIHVDSWFRCKELNTYVGGAEGSAHMYGWAIDFICPGFGTPLEIVKAIESSGLAFDQCIQEGNWVHISFDKRLRGRILTAHFGPTGTTYTEGA